jgi:hypothetical protein
MRGLLTADELEPHGRFRIGPSSLFPDCGSNRVDARRDISSLGKPAVATQVLFDGLADTAIDIHRCIYICPSD